MNQKIALVFAALVALAASGFVTKQDQDLVGVLAGDERFTTLVVAVQAAELVETLQGEGPFTVLAPTNDAFGKIPAEDLEALLQDKPALTAVLLRHVIAGRYLSTDGEDGTYQVPTVGGEYLTVVKSGDVVTITNAAGTTATVIEADILASNGVAHAIDTVV